MFEFYKKFKCRLVPLKTNSKIPARQNWVGFEGVNPDDFPGASFGWVLDKNHLVLDFDPRHNGHTTLKELATEYESLTGEKLSSSFPIVRTPRGGVHIYMTKPESLKTYKQLKDQLPGVDILSYGAYCVTAGSKSEFGDYHFQKTFDPLQGPQPIPGFILNKIRRVQNENTSTTSGGVYADLTGSQIEKMLAQLPVEDFTDYGSWLQVLQSVHEASAGEALEIFLGWSLSDPTYSGDRESIVKQWNGHQPGKKGNTTAGTLITLVKDYGGTIPEPDTSEELGRLPDLDQDVPKTVGDITRDGRETAKIPVSQVERMIDELEATGKIERLDPILRLLLKIQRPDKNRLLKKLTKKTQYLVSDLRDRMVILKGSEIDTPALNQDPAYQVTDILLSDGFDAMDRVVHAADQRFWAYQKTHWHLVERNIIRNKILIASQKWAAQNPDRKTSLATLLGQAERVLEARLASSVDFHGHRQVGDTIINCLNGELLVNADSGRVKLLPHNPKNWLTHCLRVEWNPNAECPQFDKFLSEVFEPLPDSEDVIRHLWELLGYTMQTCKDIATWVLLTGEGSNGKTTLLNILQALLGEAALSSSISEITKDNHGMSSLPGKLVLIDEDLNHQYRLPDGFLKKVSENKVLPANPKFEKAFMFENTAIVWMAANSIPSTKDMSHGMIRRAQVLHFGRIFLPHEQDRGLAKRVIKNELSGILVHALQGLQRLRLRGYFDVPKSAQMQAKKWSTEASPISLWCHSSIRRSPEDVLLRDAYAHFRLWCDEQGFSKAASKPAFKKALDSAGFDIGHGGGNKIYIKNISLIKIEEDGLEI